MADRHQASHAGFNGEQWFRCGLTHTLPMIESHLRSVSMIVSAGCIGINGSDAWPDLVRNISLGSDPDTSSERRL
jgi:hypothetical protein